MDGTGQQQHTKKSIKKEMGRWIEQGIIKGGGTNGQ
jgi:hypothetical protein